MPSIPVKRHWGRSTDLTRPQRDERAKGIAGVDSCPRHLLDSGAKGSREGAGGTCLNFDLCHLKRAERDVSKDFRRCGTDKPDGGLVFVGQFLASEIGVEILEDLIEAILEHALCGVADKCGSEPFPDPCRTLLLDESSDSGKETTIFDGVDLAKMSG